MHVSLAECDAEIELQLQRLQVHEGDPAKDKKRGRARNAPKFDLRTQLFQMCGVDLTRIDGMDVTTALAVVSEVCTDLSACQRAEAPQPVHDAAGGSCCAWGWCSPNCVPVRSWNGAALPALGSPA